VSVFDRLRTAFASEAPVDSADETGATDDDSPDLGDSGSEPVPMEAEASTHPPAANAGVPYRPGDPRFPDVWGRRTS
jgi:hypothetical protein